MKSLFIYRTPAGYSNKLPRESVPLLGDSPFKLLLCKYNYLLVFIADIMPTQRSPSKTH